MDFPQKQPCNAIEKNSCGYAEDNDNREPGAYEVIHPASRVLLVSPAASFEIPRKYIVIQTAHVLVRDRHLREPPERFRDPQILCKLQPVLLQPLQASAWTWASRWVPAS